ATPSLIDERQLLAANLDLVSMQQGRGLRTQTNAVDENFGFRDRFGDDDLTVLKDLQLCMAGENAWNGEGNGAAWVGAE
ncbi:MAG TPA: hypothetical protein VN803_06395, partial [Gemmatimonadales bacterium]|nr:hypothetical protein [Gemmatimonadales bacterium]